MDFMPEPAPSLRQLLAFYLEAGVDCALGDEPVDRLAEPDSIPAPPPPRRARSRRSEGCGKCRRRWRHHRGPILRWHRTPRFPRRGKRRAPRPRWKRCARLLENFDGCALKHTATRLVFADGNPQARVMFVGEAPGRDEDIEGLPFVGRSGKLLDRMIAAIGLDRSKAYIANVIPWRPPGNRTPTPQETQICLPFIQRQIELVNPDVLVTLGNPSTQTLLSTREGIMKTRGRWFDYDTGTRTIRAIATFHPAYLLRSPSYKRMTWQDLRAIATALETPRRRQRCSRKIYCPFGRTMAQPTRSSGCLPFTIHSKARGTSGTRPGKRCASSGGGVPEVSDARQTTTPPVSLNFATDSHGVRSGVASSSRCGRPASIAMKLASCGSPVTARSLWLVRRSKLSPKKCAIAFAGSEVGTSALPVQGRNSVVAIATKAGAAIAAAQTERSSRWRRR